MKSTDMFYLTAVCFVQLPEQTFYKIYERPLQMPTQTKELVKRQLTASVDCQLPVLCT